MTAYHYTCSATVFSAAVLAAFYFLRAAVAATRAPGGLVFRWAMFGCAWTVGTWILFLVTARIVPSP